MDWDRQKIKECLEILARLPDFDALLFPDMWGKEYDIPITPAKIYDLNEFMKAHKKVVNFAEIESHEIRGAAEGGVREVIGEEPYVPEVIVKTLTDNDEQPLPELEPVHPTKAENETTPQESQALGPTGTSQPIDASEYIGPSVRGPCE